MTHAVTLPAAAGLAYDNLQIKALIDQLPQNAVFFCQSFSSRFSDGDPNSHPMLNWAAIFWSFASMLSNPVSIEALATAAEYTYRVCWMANQLQVQGLITTDQANGVLSDYNEFFG